MNLIIIQDGFMFEIQNLYTLILKFEQIIHIIPYTFIIPILLILFNK
jgi:hypothetical protein